MRGRQAIGVVVVREGRSEEANVGRDSRYDKDYISIDEWRKCISEIE